MFTNKLINDVHATRYIASWLKMGGHLRTGADIDYFRDWLLSMEISDDDAYRIINLATCGRMELEYNARTFMKTHAPYKDGVL